MGELNAIWALILDHAGIIEILASLIAIISVGWRFGHPLILWFSKRVWTPIAEAKTRVPKRTFIVQRGDRRATFWADGRVGDEPLMQIRIWLHLSNIATQPVRVSNVWLHFRRWAVLSDKREGDIEIRHPDSDRFGDFPVLAGRMGEAIAHWLISPPFQKQKRPIRVRVQLIDQFGNGSRSERFEVFFVDDPRHIR